MKDESGHTPEKSALKSRGPFPEINQPLFTISATISAAR
jgi:hypothetical protein